MFRVFKRKVWKPNRTWPNGFEPYACPPGPRTLLLTSSEQEARDFCAEANQRWRKYQDKVRAGTASRTQVNVYHNSPRYEYERV